MVYDAGGVLLRRAIGFIRAYTRVLEPGPDLIAVETVRSEATEDEAARAGFRGVVKRSCCAYAGAPGSERSQ